MTLNLDFFSTLGGSSERLSSFSGDGSLEPAGVVGRDGGLEGGREGVLDGGREPRDGPLTEEFLELCLEPGIFAPPERIDLLGTRLMMNCPTPPGSQFFKFLLHNYLQPGSLLRAH